MSIDRTVKCSTMEEIDNLLCEIALILAENMKSENIEGKTITVKFKRPTFQVFTRSKTVLEPIKTYEDIMRYARKVLCSFLIQDYCQRISLGCSIAWTTNIQHSRLRR